MDNNRLLEVGHGVNSLHAKYLALYLYFLGNGSQAVERQFPNEVKYLDKGYCAGVLDTLSWLSDCMTQGQETACRNMAMLYDSPVAQTQPDEGTEK